MSEVLQVSNAVRNATRHGVLAGRVQVIRGEKRAEFEALRAALAEEHKPATATEGMLVDRIAWCVWRMRRAVRAEAEVMEQESYAWGRETERYIGLRRAFRAAEDQIRLLVRYETALERSMYRALAALKELQRGRALPAAGERA